MWLTNSDVHWCARRILVVVDPICSLVSMHMAMHDQINSILVEKRLKRLHGNLFVQIQRTRRNESPSSGIPETHVCTSGVGDGEPGHSAIADWALAL